LASVEATLLDAAAMAQKRVLVVDDHPPTVALVRAILEAEKHVQYEVLEARTGTECLKTVDQKGPFDLILLDVNLPDMDGFSVCRALRNVETKVPIVFVTAQGDLKDFAAGREAGGDSYLVKPIARNALRSIVGLLTNIDRTRAHEFSKT
jgi:CheY-like chemotaxis protein